jgi:hypothetical protein
VEVEVDDLAPFLGHVAKPLRLDTFVRHFGRGSDTYGVLEKEFQVFAADVSAGGSCAPHFADQAGPKIEVLGNLTIGSWPTRFSNKTSSASRTAHRNRPGTPG